MAEEAPGIPPPRVPIRGYTTPVNKEGFYTERIDFTASDYEAIPRGTKYSTIRGADQNVIDLFAELYFLRETREPGQYPWANRYWATDTFADDTYNSAVEYVSEAVTFPAYTRVYTVRRDSYEANTTLPIGQPLTSLIALKMLENGGDYTFATVKIEGTGTDAEAEAVIGVDGEVVSIVVTKCGTGYTEPPTITIEGDGGGAKAAAIIQPQSAVLVSQKKTEFPEEKFSTGGTAYMHPLRNEYVIITRVYETLPGPWVISQKEDDDGGLVTVKTRRNISANIVVEEAINGVFWSDTTKKGVDDFVAEETVESRDIVVDATTEAAATRMYTTRVDEDGKTVTVTRLQASRDYLSSIAIRETVAGGIWKRITSEPISHLKVWMITETRVVPGNNVPSAQVDQDNEIETIGTILKQGSTVTPAVSEAGGVITKVDKKAVSDLVAQEITSHKPIFDAKSFSVKIPILIPERFRGAVPIHSETHVHAGTAVMPTLGTGEFERTNAQEAELIEKQEVTSIDATTLPVSLIDYKMTKDKQLETITETLDSGLQTLAGSISALTIEASVESIQADTDGTTLLSLKTVGTVTSLFNAKLSAIETENPIPPEFRRLIPTYHTATTLAATTVADPQILGTGELSRSEERLDEFTIRRSITTLPSTGLPVHLLSYELTEQYGGGVLEVEATLDDSPLTIDQGLLVTSSYIQDMHNGLFLKVTKRNTVSAWPELVGTHVDPKYGLVIGLKKQVLAAGTLGGVDVDGTIREVQVLDVWRSVQLSSKLDTDSLPDDVQYFDSMRHSFPPELSDAIIDWAEATCGCSDSFSAVLLANVKQYSGVVKTRMTEQFYNGPPPDDVTIDQFFPEAHHFGFAWASFCGDADGNCRTKSGAPEFRIPLCLHDDLSLSVGAFHVWTFAATSPAALPHGSYIMLAPHVERWRFGVFRRVLVEVLVP